MKQIYNTPEVEVNLVAIERTILSNGENVNVRRYVDESSEDPWA